MLLPRFPGRGRGAFGGPHVTGCSHLIRTSARRVPVGRASAARRGTAEGRARTAVRCRGRTGSLPVVPATRRGPGQRFASWVRTPSPRADCAPGSDGATGRRGPGRRASVLLGGDPFRAPAQLVRSQPLTAVEPGNGDRSAAFRRLPRQAVREGPAGMLVGSGGRDALLHTASEDEGGDQHRHDENSDHDVYENLRRRAGCMSLPLPGARRPWMSGGGESTRLAASGRRADV